MELGPCLEELLVGKVSLRLLYPAGCPPCPIRHALTVFGQERNVCHGYDFVLDFVFFPKLVGEAELARAAVAAESAPEDIASLEASCHEAAWDQATIAWVELLCHRPRLQFSAELHFGPEDSPAS